MKRSGSMGIVHDSSKKKIDVNLFDSLAEKQVKFTWKGLPWQSAT